MINTKNPTALQSQKWILQALLDLMQSTEYDKITVSEICRKAELDRRTFYRNFDSKSDVLEEYIEHISKEYITEFNKRNPTDNYSATLLFFLFWRNYIPFIINIQNCGLSNFVFQRFEKFVMENQQLLIVNNIADTRTVYIFAYKIGGFWNVMLTWAANNAAISPEELTDIITNI